MSSACPKEFTTEDWVLVYTPHDEKGNPVNRVVIKQAEDHKSQTAEYIRILTGSILFRANGEVDPAIGDTYFKGCTTAERFIRVWPWGPSVLASSKYQKARGLDKRIEAGERMIHRDYFVAFVERDLGPTPIHFAIAQPDVVYQEAPIWVNTKPADPLSCFIRAHTNRTVTGRTVRMRKVHPPTSDAQVVRLYKYRRRMLKRKPRVDPFFLNKHTNPMYLCESADPSLFGN